jgi:uncharacterized protein (DUF608 family)
VPFMGFYPYVVTNYVPVKKKSLATKFNAKAVNDANSSLRDWKAQNSVVSLLSSWSQIYFMVCSYCHRCRRYFGMTSTINPKLFKIQI